MSDDAVRHMNLSDIEIFPVCGKKYLLQSICQEVVIHTRDTIKGERNTTVDIIITIKGGSNIESTKSR